MSATVRGVRTGRRSRGVASLARSVDRWLYGLFTPGDRPWFARVRAAQGVLVITLLGAAGLTGVWVSRPVALEPGLVERATQEARESGAETRDRPPGDPVTFSARRLFQQPRVLVRKRATRANVTLSELSRKLTLQGILWGDTPRAIVENRSTDQVLHLTAGEFVGEIRIAEVRRNSVLLSWKDETLELIL